MARAQVPQFGNWESEDNVPYTVYFENAGKGKKGGKLNPNDHQDYPDAQIKVQKGQEVTRAKHARQSSREDGGEMRRSADSPLHSDAMSQKSTTGSPHHRQGGLRYASNRQELEGHRALVMHSPRHELQLSREEGDMRRPADYDYRNENANRRFAHDSPYHRHSGLSDGETPKRVGRNSLGSDRSIEQSPLHPHSQARSGAKGSAISSPSWERKVSPEGSHGLAPTPGRSRLRSVTKGDDAPDHSPAVPVFGDWDESDPASAEGYSHIFNRVREEKQTGAGKEPTTPSGTSYGNGQKRIASSTAKGCGCFPWSR